MRSSYGRSVEVFSLVQNDLSPVKAVCCYMTVCGIQAQVLSSVAQC